MHEILSIEQIGNRNRQGRGGDTASRPARGRVRVTMEDGESFVLPSSKVSRLGLEEGGEIAEETFEEIMKSLRATCMQRCGTLLGSRDYSEQRLREKLCDAGFPAPLVEDAVDKLHRAGYLDDRRYARSYVRSHLQDRSRLRITRDLTERGISGTDIEEAFAEVGREEDIEEAQKEQVLRLLRKRGFDPDRATYEERQKTMAFLHRKGYPADLIRRAAEGDYR